MTEGDDVAAADVVDETDNGGVVAPPTLTSRKNESSLVKFGFGPRSGH